MMPHPPIKTCSKIILCFVFLSLANGISISRKVRGTNRLFLDSANLSDWNDLLPLGIFHG